MGTRIRNNPDHLYELFCEVAIPSSCTEAATIIWKYPHNFKDEETLKSLPQFAYPVEFTDNAVQHFSFVFTNIDSKWTFGFCRHAPNYPACYVILSYLPWHETFYRVLNQAAELSNREKPAHSRGLQSFLESLYKVQVPDPGLKLCVSCEGMDFTASCPDHNKLPSIPENRNMTEYFNAIDAMNMMTIFASMLHERRILVLSKKLSRLSACVQAANALIYPMHWQHIFIPILPKHLVDYLSAPMPFLIGIPSSTYSRMKPSDIGDVVLLDADNNKVESPYADLDALPSEVLQSLRHDLKNPQEMLGDCVARAFLKASVKLIGGYWNALKLKPGEKISFDPELFLQTRPAPVQPFLEKILQLQIFQQFIESRLKMLNSGQGVCDEFEFELTAHEDKSSTRLRNQYRDWVSFMKKEGGAFFKNVKKQMKVTGKKAYKDIRSRIHEMHHHKMMENDVAPANRKRISSVPSLSVNGLDLGCQSGHSRKNISGEQVSKSKAEQSNQTLEKPAYNNPSENTSLTDSLTFKPLDMDLMGDLHDLLFRSCSLCGDRAQKRTSISDPQLIDFNTDDVRCSSCQSHCYSKEEKVGIEEVPPPLLPRPPTTKSSLKNSYLYPSKGSLDSSSRYDKPLIQLDTDSLNSHKSEDDVFLTSVERNGNYHPSSTTNPFERSSTNYTGANNYFVPKGRSSNPFHQSVPQGYSIGKCSSGPNVKELVHQWQSSGISSNNNSSIGRSKSPVLNVLPPYRSQPLARTSSTPPVTYAGLSASSVSKNPFLVNSEIPSKTTIVDNSVFQITQKNTSISWESFQ